MPRVVHLPEYETTASGQEAVDLARAAGLVLDPWQAWTLEHACSEVRDPQTGRLRWAAFEVGAFVSRQNGKGGIIEGRELASLALFGERVIHSSHHFRTTRDAFERLQAIIENCPDLDRLVQKITTANGNEGIKFRGGGRIQYFARERGSGRGLPPDVVVNDEAFDYPERAHTALMPAMSARPNPQIWYTSSPPDEEEHPNAVVISRLRARALAGGDPSLMWAEWSAAEAAEFLEMLERSTREQRIAWLGDRAKWSASNPALGYRITEGFIAKELRSMSARGFAVERLGIGFWPDPEPDDDTDERPWAATQWEDVRDDDSLPLDPVALALDVDPAGNAALAVQAWRGDGHKHGELIQFAKGTGWVIPVVLALIDAWDPAVLVVDSTGPAGAMVPKLLAAGLEPVVTTVSQAAAADTGLASDVEEQVIRVRGYCKPLDDAAESVRWRWSGDRKLFDRRRGGASITPLRALSLAGFGLDLVAANPPKKAAAPTPEPIPGDGGSLDGGLDLARVQF